jgi:DNA-binding NarL/FixJ family response regulator
VAGHGIVTGMPSHRVLIVDDHRSFAEALALRLSAEPDLVVVGTVTVAADVEACVADVQPDIVLLDAELGRGDGIAIAHRLRTTSPTVSSIIVTFRDDAATACAAVRSGAVGFVAKDVALDDLLAAVRAVGRGERWIQPRLLGAVLDELARHPGTLSEDQRRIAALSDRERDVLQHLVHGKDRATIARELFLSTNTVRTHTRNLLAKLDVHSSLEAVALALRAGMRPSGTGSSVGSPTP